MRKIIVSDITLCAASEGRRALSFKEKLNIAERLEEAGADFIELPAVSGSKEDIVVYRTIASSVKKCGIMVDAGDNAEAIDNAWECIKDSANAGMQVVMPISTVQMEYMYHLKAPKMLERIADMCAKATALCDRVEFVARDASRAEEGFAAKCCKAAYENGAKSVTLCDDGGVFFPENFASLVKEIKAACDIKVYVQPSDELGMAVACAVEALKAGADGVKVSSFGVGLRAHLLADVLRAKGDSLGIMCGLDVTAIHNIDSLILSSGDKSLTPVNEVAVIENDTALDSSVTLTEIITAVNDLGYELSDEDNGKVYEEFKRVVAKKKTVGARELEAIIASSAMQVPSTFHVISYVVNSGNIITATANITLEKDGEKLSGVSTGDGPIDAAFHAIEQIIGHHYELDDFQVHAVTKGREAVGSSLIRLRDGGKLYSGNGVSTDVVGACIRAYINALNKIVYEEN